MKAVMISDQAYLNAIRMSLLEMAAEERAKRKVEVPSKEELDLVRVIASETGIPFGVDIRRNM